MLIPALKKTYKDQVVLDLPEFEVPDGSIMAVCGQNGSGKSTLAKILAGIIPADNGSNPLPSVRTGYMTQRSMAFKMSVRRNLMLNADPAQSKEEQKKRAGRLLEVLGMESLARKNAQKMSGGQIQRMSLARLLMKPYDLLILDEPTASMDTEVIPVCEKLLLDYHAETGCTILLITHSPDQTRRLTDRILFLEKGKRTDAPPQW